MLAAVAALTMLQAAFVWPVRTIRPIAHGRSLKLSLAIAALLVAIEIGVIFGAVIDLGVLHGSLPEPAEQIVKEWGWWMVGLVGLSWMIATPLLIAFTRPGRVEHVLGRLACRLFLGSMIELLATLPLAVLIRRKESCYCSTGTYFGMIACCGIGWLVLGPAIVLPMIARRRRARYTRLCPGCNYDMSGCLASKRCPECGAAWSAPAHPLSPAIAPPPTVAN